ncbi:hypothetical protein LFYK43_00980 [Ligilactobacillus salitolerans]|uniref:HTH cro/C1-type domain-containing protein n=1 Tax=Ligilactobacillus salitolerans TaxID=1808352 RepID=A0A401IQ22_9LACO|nr:helix-turn-helix transcriptional regulator [Ligilactobacillus salitolerans]GBG93639.1 hypothetical protein LFYK43_00980 [Ligilactobacillus salitolerans]
MDLGQFLKNSRQNCALSQNNVATQLHISRQAISSWETGKSYPDIDNLMRLSNLYHFNLDEILCENQHLREKIATNEQKNVVEQQKIKKVDHKLASLKDEGLLLLALACLSFVIAPFGLVTTPFVFWRNQKTNTCYKFVYVVCVCALVYNAFVLVAFIANSLNWGITSYY